MKWGSPCAGDPPYRRLATIDREADMADRRVDRLGLARGQPISGGSSARSDASRLQQPHHSCELLLRAVPGCDFLRSPRPRLCPWFATESPLEGSGPRRVIRRLPMARSKRCRASFKDFFAARTGLNPAGATEAGVAAAGPFSDPLGPAIALPISAEGRAGQNQ
jgi:hypothetical protein